MPMQNSDVVKVLNELIETCKDGEYGFRTCATNATASALKLVFDRRAQDCASGAAELQSLVSRYGGTPEESGSLLGTMHRGWVKVVDAVSGTSDKAILDECERGEDAALARYRAALKETDLPTDVRAVLVRQQEGVQRNHDQVKALRDGYAESKSA